MPYWIDKLDKLNPVLCRLVARVPHRRKCPLTNEQIAQRSGLTVRRVRYLSKLTTWATISIEEMEKFKMGCGITPGRECMEVAYTKRSLNKTIVKSGLYHIRRLLHKSRDPRLKKYFVELMQKVS